MSKSTLLRMDDEPIGDEALINGMEALLAMLVGVGGGDRMINTAHDFARSFTLGLLWLVVRTESNASLMNINEKLWDAHDCCQLGTLVAHDDKFVEEFSRRLI